MNCGSKYAGPSKRGKRIVRLLQARAGAIVTYDELFAAVWPEDPARRLQCLRQEIWMIRQHLGPEAIATVPTVGYLWVNRTE